MKKYPTTADLLIPLHESYIYEQERLKEREEVGVDEMEWEYIKNSFVPHAMYLLQYAFTRQTRRQVAHSE